LSLHRYDSLDILKAICAFLVVCIHCPFPGEFGRYISSLSRIAVVIFFMITGFFYDGIVKRNAVKSQIRKMLTLLIKANLLFLGWSILLNLHNSSGGLVAYFEETFSAKSILKFILLNASPVGYHLWYLGAIFYVLIIYAVADKLHLRKLLYIVTPILLIGDLALGKYSLVIFGREFPYILVRNFLFVGLPYFSIGCLLKKYESIIRERLNNALLIGLAGVFVITTILERYILIAFDLSAARDHYISTTLLSVTLFMIALKGKGLFSGKGRVAQVLSNVGRKYSTWIYILHPIVITASVSVMSKLGIYSFYEYVAPVAVYIATAVFVACVSKIWKRMRRVDRHRKG
ncbi:MAG: acyltransferase, partial [Ruminococcus sp.]|nr:acyltransferase [Ruminococcus sp.]